MPEQIAKRSVDFESGMTIPGRASLAGKDVLAASSNNPACLSIKSVTVQKSSPSSMVSDPEEASITLPLAAIPVLTSTFITELSFPTRQLRGSIPSTFRLTACLLAVLRLKLYVTIQPPRTCYPVVGQPSGAGFTPAELDLARPHNKSVSFYIYSAECQALLMKLHRIVYQVHSDRISILTVFESHRLFPVQKIYLP
ncbi:MAG: hypothetical protein KJ717_00680 [Proteobacteria bacterium]|nr:hypothetical protein [Pseudomonadota bacterium]